MRHKKEKNSTFKLTKVDQLLICFCTVLLFCSVFLGYIQANLNVIDWSDDFEKVILGPESLTLKISINTADAKQLQKIPQVGSAIAQRIIEYRTENGPFEALTDLIDVQGIGENNFNIMKPYIEL